MKIAVEGCCHGELDAIYETIQFRERKENCKIDLLLICGDFQSIRNTSDMDSLACPAKYRKLGMFHEYYTGQKKAPYLTIFVGGNHEASNYLWELYHGGWVCPNIYFLGYAGIVNFGGLRIGGISGIHKPHHFNMGHFEKSPYSDDQLRSVYHVRRYDVDKLSLIQEPLDIIISHDWPRGIERFGDCERLMREKPFFRGEIQTNSLGSSSNEHLLRVLKPRHWFSAHLHVKFEALVRHEPLVTTSTPIANPDEIVIDDFDDDDGTSQPSIAQQSGSGDVSSVDTKETRPIIRETRFLALDKCLRKRQFLQIIDFPEAKGPLELTYDAEWLAIVCATNEYLSLTRHTNCMPPEDELRRKIEDQYNRLRELAKDREGGLRVPDNFAMNAPAGQLYGKEREQYRFPLINPQTVAFCEMLEINNKINADGQTYAAGQPSAPAANSQTPTLPTPSPVVPQKRERDIASATTTRAPLNLPPPRRTDGASPSLTESCTEGETHPI